jgi:serine/threonine protein phosphatase 1
MSKILTYAVADVHGCASLLSALVDACVADAQALDGSPRFVFVGDVLDKGRSSRLALDKVCEVLAEFGGSQYVRGNHEELAIAALSTEGNEEIDQWLRRGGMNTLDSYCLNEPETAFGLMQTMHSDHIRAMESSVDYVMDGMFMITHAGVDPRRPLMEQDSHDLRWVRKEFLDHVGHLPAVVVHGHTVVGDRPVVTENRVSIDTGAFASGRLTACVLDQSSDRVRFLQTDGTYRAVIEVDPVREDRGLGTCLDRVHDRRAAALLRAAA